MNARIMKKKRARENDNYCLGEPAIDRERWVSINEYAQLHKRAPSTIRRQIQHHRFHSLQHIGRDNFLLKSEPYPRDLRVKEKSKNERQK